jgi:threonine-phosphate decarboxylase
MQNTELEIADLVKAKKSDQKRLGIRRGTLQAVMQRFDFDRKRIIDFSSNVNPLGPSSSALRAAKKSLSLIDRYPDPVSTQLRKAIARYHGIAPEQVLCGNGSLGLIHLIPRCLKPKKVLIPIPTFPEYATAVEAAGGEVVPFRLKERSGFHVDPVEMAFALTGMDMALLCNPNEPTGMLVNKEEMAEIMRSAAQHGVQLVVDEAFMDYCDASTMIKEAVQSSNLICIRTFSTFFGMPGLRVGYAVSNESTIKTLREGQEFWAASVPAEQAAIAALNDWGHIKKTRRLIEQERDRLLSDLRVLPGVETFLGAANFILIKLISFDAGVLCDKLGERGLLVREGSSIPGLDGRYLQIAVRTRRENKRLIRALRELLIR